MIIRLLYLILFFAGLNFSVLSQGFEWIRSEPVSYSLNPSYPESSVAFDQANSRVVHSRIDTVALIDGSFALGTSFVESRDTTGSVLWQYQFGNYASIQRVATDLSGNKLVYRNEDAGQELINVKNLSDGIYSLVFTNENSIVRKKLIVVN